MRELLICLSLDIILSIVLIILKITGVLLWEWWFVTISILTFIPILTVLLIGIPLLIIIYNNTK